MKLSEFEMSRFSSRTVWVAVAVVGVVLALFFIPEIINFQKSITGSKTERVAQRSAVEALDASDESEIIPENDEPVTEENILDEPEEPVVELTEQEPDSEKASVSNAALRDISADLDEQAESKATSTKEKIADVPAAPKKGGILSGFKLRAGGDGTAVIANLDRLSGKEVQAFFRKGKNDVSRFVESSSMREPRLRDVVDALLQAFEVVASGGLANMSEETAMKNHLVALNNGTLARMRATGFDRGLMLQWQEIPVLGLISHLPGATHIQSDSVPFVPGITLRQLTIRAQRRGPPKFNAEIGIRGTDVEKIEVFQRGVAIRAPGLSGSDRDGFRNLRLSGDADGMWTVLVYDKFGSPPYQKSYAFYPRIRRFAKNPDGSYRISFRQPTPQNALDRFFTASYTNRSRTESPRDPSVGVF